MTQEQLKLQKRAGIITEKEYKAQLEKLSNPLNESIGGVVSLGVVGSTKDPIDYFFSKKYLNEAEDIEAIGDKATAAIKDELEAEIARLSPEEKDKLRDELAKASQKLKVNITADSNVKDIATKLDESLNEVEGDTKAQLADTFSNIGGGIMKSMLIPIIPLIAGHATGTGFAGGLAITALTAGALIALAKALGAEKTNEVKKKLN